MPSIITHGIIGYILFDWKGLLLSLIPDIVGFSYYFYKLIFVDKTLFKSTITFLLLKFLKDIFL